MPAPQSSHMQQLARQQFASFGLTLPVDWRTPSADPAADHYRRASSDLEHDAPLPVGGPLLFQAATTNRYHTEAAQEISDRFIDYLDGICAAICSAWRSWHSAATLVGVNVNAVTAAGGTLLGPPWLPLILSAAPMSTAQEACYSKAIATAVSDGWQTYRASITLPGLPLFPAFAAFPGPMAPPTPNLPVPIIALTQVAVSFSKAALKAAMIANLGAPDALHHVELMDSVAEACAKCFQTWQIATQVTNLLGTGPIPTFNPPWVLVGPVVGGTAIMAAGGLQ